MTSEVFAAADALSLDPDALEAPEPLREPAARLIVGAMMVSVGITTWLDDCLSLFE